jgi:hypothetical protein
MIWDLAATFLKSKNYISKVLHIYYRRSYNKRYSIPGKVQILLFFGITNVFTSLLLLLVARHKYNVGKVPRIHYVCDVILPFYIVCKIFRKSQFSYRVILLPYIVSFVWYVVQDLTPSGKVLLKKNFAPGIVESQHIWYEVLQTTYVSTSYLSPIFWKGIIPIYIHLTWGNCRYLSCKAPIRAF